MTAAPSGYGRKTTTAAAPPPGYQRAKPSFMQQAFDITNPTTGKSYIYGNTPPPAPYEDVQRTVRDTLSRGAYDKFLGGPEAQAKTEQSRERMPDWVELPTDVGAAVYGSPYRIAGAGMGAVAGGLEGMASAYGHQKGWVPDVGNMLWEGGKGAVLGAGGAKLGQKIGDWWGGRQAAKELPYKTDADVEAAANKSFKEDPTSPQTLDLYDRTARLEAARAAQGEGRGAFAKLQPGNEAEAVAQAAIAKGKSLTTRAGELASMAGKTFSGPGMVAEMMIPPHIPWKTLAGMAVATAANKAGKSQWATRVPEAAAEHLATIIRDPKGVGAVADPATVAAARSLFAKTMIGASRSPTTPDPQDYLNRRTLFGGPR